MNEWLETNRWFVFGVIVLICGTVFTWAVTHPAAEPEPIAIEMPTPETPPPTPLPPTPSATPSPAPLRVYISGEVRQPDVYVLPPGSIIKDAILAAGGSTADADLDVVNQAQELSDQQHIHIPAQADDLPTPPVVEGGVSRTTVIPVSATAEPAKINLNTASLQSLELLPGVGPSIAQRIIDYRAEQGEFAKPEDVMNVKGIGPSTFAKFENLIVVE